MSDFDPEWASINDWAAEYRRLGLQAVPALPPSTSEQWKRPAIKWREHEDALVDDATFEGWFGHNRRPKNIGILTGAASSTIINGVKYKLHVMDLDTYKSDASMNWWRSRLDIHNNGMDLETVTQRTGGGGLQMFFWVPDTWTAPTAQIAILGLDFRGTGGFIMCPPSSHTSGDNYAFLPGMGPHEIEIAVAPDWYMREVEALVAQHGGKASAGTQGPITRTDTPDAPRTLSGRLLDGREAYMTQLVWCAVLDCYEESPIRSSLIEERDAAYSRYSDNVAPRLQGMEHDAALEAEGRGRSLFNDKWATALSRWDTGVKEAVAARKTNPEPFQVEYYDPETGEVLDAPPEPSTAAQDDDWDAPAIAPAPEPLTNVWDPWERFPLPSFPLDCLPAKVREYVRVSSISTGGDINACAMTALAVAGASIDQSFRLKMGRTGNWEVPPLIWLMLFGEPSTKKTPIIKSFLWPLQKVEAEARKAYQTEVARWKAAGGEKGDEPEKPMRYITSDATVEKIADILTRQDRGILMHKDELSGWLAAMDSPKSGKEAEKSFWTSAYNGGSHAIDRVLRGETFVSNLAIPLIGGMQPDEMAKMPDLTSNGLMQRFLPCVMLPAVMRQEIEDGHASVSWENMIRLLTSLEPHRLLSSDGALQHFETFQREMMAFEAMKGLGSKFTTFIGKLAGMQGAIAMILHLMDNLWDQPVSADAAERAGRILKDFCIPHAMAFYGATGDSGDVEQMRSLASYVLTADKDRFMPSDFSANCRSMRGMSMWEMAKRVSPLVVNGWLEEDYSKGGGGIKGWMLRPGIREALQSRRAEQQDQRKKVASMMSSYRRGAVK